MARKKKGPPQEEAEAGAPAWALTFGDLMTQLLTFFILLFSISDVKTQKIYEVFKSFRTYFHVDVPETGYTIRSLDDSFQALSEMAFDVPDQHGQEGHADVVVSEKFGKYVSVEAKDESIKLSIAAETLFEKGSATLAPQAKEKLAVVAEKLSGYWTRIKILGHTSPLPLPPGSPFTDHFALGTARSKAVADTIVGVWRDMGRPQEEVRLEVASRGRNDPPKEYTNIAQYDRVEIIFTAEPVRHRATLIELGKKTAAIDRGPQMASMGTGMGIGNEEEEKE